MPEGHSIYIAAVKQHELLGGQTVAVTSPQGRFLRAKDVDGNTLEKVEGVGKHLFYHFLKGRRPARRGRGLTAPVSLRAGAQGSILHVHLGRLGRFRYWPGPTPGEPSGACRLRLRGPTATVDLSGPTACDLVSPVQREAILARLGPDPLRADADPDKAWARIRKSRKAIGALLLDQSIIAGLGNIFRAEILFRLRLHPAIRGDELTRKQFNAIWKDSVAMLRQGVKYGWIITTTAKAIKKPLAQAAGGVAGDRFWVYRRKACRVCGGEIATLTLAGRALYYCPLCQGRQ